MSRIYPRLGNVRDMRRVWTGKSPKCCVCGAKATHRVDIEWWHMRGDDDVANVCDAHKSDLAAIVATFKEAS